MIGFARRGAEEAEIALEQLGRARGDEPGYDTTRPPITPAQLDVVERLAQARRTPFFANTHLTVIGRLIQDDAIEILSAGNLLWSEGDPIDRMAFVVDGQLSRVSPTPARKAPAGAVLGAREILSEGGRSETWKADSMVRLLSIGREDFLDALEDHFDFALEYMRFCSADTISAWSNTPAASASEGGLR